MRAQMCVLAAAIAVVVSTAVVWTVDERSQAEADGKLAGEITGALESRLGVHVGGGDIHVGGGGVGVGIGGGHVGVGIGGGHGRPDGNPPSGNPPGPTPNPRDKSNEDEAKKLIDALGQEGLQSLLGELAPEDRQTLLAKCRRAHDRPPDARAIGPNLRKLCDIILSLP